MLSFIGKVFLAIAALLGVRTAAGSRGRARGQARSAGGRAHPLLSGAGPSGAVSGAGRGERAVAAPRPTDEVAGRLRQDSGKDRDEETGGPVGDAERVSGAIEAARHRSASSPVAGRSETAADDPLAAKHRSPSFDRDFRTVDYGNLSKEDAAEARRKQREREGSTWEPPKDGAKGSPEPATRAQFAQFSGSVVSADVMRGDQVIGAPDRPADPGREAGTPGDGGAAAGNPAGPARLDKLPLEAPDPDGPTPSGEERQRAGIDPLAAKHRAEPFDSDFRTVDYGRLGGPGHDGTAGGDTGSDVRNDPGTSGAPTRPDGAFPDAFQVAGVAGPLQGASGAGTQLPDGPAAPGAAGEDLSEPSRLDEPDEGGPDDLTSIRGIGPTLERILFENGIYHFRQIAAWNEKEVRWINRTIGFRGRVEREHWIEQARALAKPAHPPRPTGAGVKSAARDYSSHRI